MKAPPVSRTEPLDILESQIGIAAHPSRRPLRGLLRMRSNLLKHNNLMLRSERRERLEAWAASDSPISHSQYQPRQRTRFRGLTNQCHMCSVLVNAYRPTQNPLPRKLGRPYLRAASGANLAAAWRRRAGNR